MARGPSGRIVIEVDPGFKRELHSALVADGKTLKEWFSEAGAQYMAERTQPPLRGLFRYSMTDDTPSLSLVAEDPAEPTKTTPLASPEL